MTLNFSAQHAGTDVETGQRLNVLVSGASFAGLATAFWMDRLGYKVTVVEIGKGLKTGGSPVDIKEGTVDIVKRMGLLERIKHSSLKAKGIDFLDAEGVRIAKMPARPGNAQDANPEYEVERDTLLHMMFDEVKGKVEFVFDDSIARLEESADEVAVTFKSGKQRSFSLLFGCDGNHSNVRRMCFGEEAAYSRFLQNYFSITIVNKLLIEEDTAQMYNVPGKVVMLNAYNNKTDIIFCFYSEKEISYAYRDQDEQRRIILQHFSGEGWRTRELLQELSCCEDFYFDKMCQIRMPAWTKSRVALVGDAAYCASPAAGMGGSLAIVGAAALADALQKHPRDSRRLFGNTTTACVHSLRRFRRELSTLGWICLFPDQKRRFREGRRSSASVEVIHQQFEQSRTKRHLAFGEQRDVTVRAALSAAACCRAAGVTQT